MKDDKTEERKAFSFLRSYYKTLQELPDDKRLRMFDAITAFAFDGCEPSNLEDWIEAAIWQGMKGTLEPSRRGWCDKMGIPYEGGAEPPCQGVEATPYQQKRREERREEEESKEEKQVFLPFETDTFRSQWQLWKQYRKQQHRFTYKSPASEQAALTELGKMSGSQEKKAIAILHHTMAHGWRGFVEPKPEESSSNMINVADI